MDIFCIFISIVSTTSYPVAACDYILENLDIEKNKLNGNKVSEMLCGSEIMALLEILKESDKQWVI